MSKKDEDDENKNRVSISTILQESTPDEIVDEIYDRMIRLQWRAGASNRELAEKYRRRVSTINEYSAEASRRIRFLLEDRDTVAAEGHVYLREAMRGLHEEKNWKDLLKGAEIMFLLSGSMAPKRMHVEVQPAQLSTEELRAMAAEAVAVLSEADPEFANVVTAGRTKKLGP